MNRFQILFSKKPQRILSVYFTAGFPERDSTVPVIEALSRAGVDMIEIGIPFSDPLADGPVIQRSSHTALMNGMSLRLLFNQLKNIRVLTEVPLVMMGYLNPILQFGLESFCREAASVGVDGLIVPDLPLREYLNEFSPVMQRHGLENILMITPETSEERVREMDALGNAFLYMVSSASTTGIRTEYDKKTLEYFGRIQALNLRNPVLTGFGVSGKETFKAACQYSRGAVVGSAFIRCLEEHPEAGEAVRDLLRTLHS